MILREVVLLALLAVAVSSAWGQAFQAGAAKRIITPDPLLPVSGGIGIPQPTTEKRGELTTRALVLREGETTVAFVAIDSLGFPSVLGDRIREKVAAIPPENILIGASHAHSTPDCYAFPDGQGGHTANLDYIDDVCAKTVEAIHEGLARLQPARLKTVVGEAQGKIAFNYYAPDLYDREMSVLQVCTPEEAVIATLVNYAIHPEVIGNRRGILSPDCIGPLCDQLEMETGGMALFMNGAVGGMVTADNRLLDQPRDPLGGYWESEGTWEECLRIGHLMASEALRLLETAEAQQAPRLHCLARRVRFPVESEMLWAVVTGSPLKYPHNDDQSIVTTLNVVTVGKAQIFTIPGEALPNIGLYLKRKMDEGSHPFLFGLTNDAFGYILTEVDFESFKRYDYISRTSLGEQTGEILIKELLAMMKEARQPGGAPVDD